MKLSPQKRSPLMEIKPKQKGAWRFGRTQSATQSQDRQLPFM